MRLKAPLLRPRLRFAPSPNGRLHLGHAYSALTNQKMARDMGGDFLIRIEDIDVARCPPALSEAALDDLAWLDVLPDGPVRWQSRHVADYQIALASLSARGLVYPCRCSHGDIARAVSGRHASTGACWPHDPDGAPLHPGVCVGGAPADDGVADGHGLAWRLNMAKALDVVAQAGAERSLDYQCLGDDGSLTQVGANPARWGDVVLARKAIGTSYHLSVVVDDALQGITHVVRGTDLEAATDVHVLLQHILGLPVPVYRFHQLIRDETGQKLAKSRGSTSLEHLRQDGFSPREVKAMLGF